MKRRLPDSMYNPVTLGGVALSLTTLAVIFFLFAIDHFSAHQNPYLGLITFMFLPAFLVLGILAIFGGVLRENHRKRTGKSTGMVWPTINLADAKSRNAVVLLAVGSFVFLSLSAFGSYQAYEYTESVQFCGRVCHSVMKPEYTAYQASPHAKVACVQCHIGPGADWFVRSKISGSYQVYSVLFKKYHRPIETPVANLRPARETCQQCHWPQHFFSAKLQGRSYYLSDETNTKSDMNMLVKIGGGDPGHGKTDGIHYHMFIANTIKYVARDKKRNDIPYIESRAQDGKVTVYKTTENPMPDAEAARAEKHEVDCIECHNRPTHVYHPPSESVNQAMAANDISPTLPQIKKVCVDALEGTYNTEDEALRAIRKTIEGFYQAQYPQVYAARKGEISAAAARVEKIYRLNYFPEMRVSWKANENHLGHLYSPGCFRCHDGKHVSADGKKTIASECTTCHTIVSQQVGNAKPRVSMTGLEFQHPGNVGDAWKMMKCSDCHGAQK